MTSQPKAAPNREVGAVAGGWKPILIHTFGKYGLLVLLVIVTVIYSIVLPNSFPTLFNFRSILSQQSIVLLAALALMVPFAAGQFDLSIGYWLGLSQILVVGFQVNQHLPWGLAILAVFGIAILIGTVNGLVVTRLHIDSFIATLGSGAVIYGGSLFYTNGQEVIGQLSSGFLALTNLGPLGIPMPAWIALVCCLALWFMLEHLPIGRVLYVMGSNPRAAELLGIRRNLFVPLVFAICSLLTATAGILVASELRVGEPTLGPEYLLPSFSAAILGTTAIRPGRVNPWGTAIAVFLLAVGISGLLQLGVRDFIQSTFNGGMLLIAMALAGYTARRRLYGTQGSIPGGAGGQSEVEVVLANAESDLVGSEVNAADVVPNG